jgi:ATP-dependent Clp protease ATP-binding subunit ClpC
MKESVMKEVKDLFRPEFINRVDEMIVFHALTEEEIRKITEMMLKQVAKRLEEQEIRLTWDDAVVAKLAADGYDPKFGARPLRRLIQRTVEDTLSEELLQGHIRLGRGVALTVKDGAVALEEVPETEPAEEKLAEKVSAEAEPAAAAPEEE